jgi:hypothetical protein
VNQTDDAVAVSGINNGFKFSVAASNTKMQQLKLNVGVDDTQGQLTAALSDRGMVSYIDSSLTDSGPGIKTHVYTINFQAQSAGQTLDVEWKSLGAGSVIISAATVSELLTQDFVLNGTAGNDQLEVKLDGADVIGLLGGVEKARVPKAILGKIIVNANTGDDTILMNLAGGITGAGTIEVHGQGGADVLQLNSAAGAVSFNPAGDQVVASGTTIGFDGVKFIGFGDGSVSLAGIPAGMGLVGTGTAQVGLTGSISMAGLKLSGDAKVSLAAGADKFLTINPASLSDLSISGNGTLDINDNDVIVNAPAEAVPDGDPSNDPAALVLDAVSTLIKNARNTPLSGSWGGAGVTSSTAKNDTSTLTGVAVIRNIDSTGGALMLNWQGQPVTKDSILVKYSFNGDADVNGSLNALDYALINGGFLSQNTPSPLKGYRNGDFDFSGNINALDYALINGAFLGQNSHTPPAPLAKVSSPFSTTKLANAPKVTKLAAKKLSAKQKARLLARRHAR